MTPPIVQERSTFKDMKYRIEAAGFFAVMGLFKFLGLERASALGGFLGRAVGPLVPGVEQRARHNLALCFPDMPEARKRAILKGMWTNLGRVMAEYPHLDKFVPYKDGGHVTVHGTENIDEVAKSGKGAIFVSGHFANWELLPMPATARGLSGGEVYRAPNNPYVNEWMIRKRLKHVYREQIPKGSAGAKQLLRILKENKQIVMLIDQKMNDGIAAPFFGYEAMTAPAAAQLALRFDVPIVRASIRRTQGPNFEITAHKPWHVPHSGDKAADIATTVTKLNEWLEEEIRSCPEQWLWLHRRWPKDLVKAETAPETPDADKPVRLSASGGS